MIIELNPNAFKLQYREMQGRGAGHEIPVYYLVGDVITIFFSYGQIGYISYVPITTSTNIYMQNFHGAVKAESFDGFNGFYKEIESKAQ